MSLDIFHAILLLINHKYFNFVQGISIVYVSDYTVILEIYQIYHIFM